MTAIITDALRAAIVLLSATRETFAAEVMLHEYDDVLAKLHAALHEAERAEQVEPVAYRVECRWADPALDQTWRKYADYGTHKAAESSQQRFAGPGNIESRIVPLYAGTPEDPR